MTTFKLKVKDYNEDGRIVTISEKEFYNLDGVVSASKWVRAKIKGNVIDVPIVKNACKVVDEGANSYTDDAIGMFHSAGNDVQNNLQKVALFTSNYTGAGSCIINKDNFNRVIAMFCARKLVDQDWLNDKDEYMVPNDTHPSYNQFIADGIIFSLFESASLQSSLRNITYKGALHNIHNQFFFLSVKEMQDLAIANNFNELYNDCVGKQDSYVYNLLKTIKLSPDAQTVLDMARYLVSSSFPLRQAAHTVKPEMHLNAWDAGWYQIRNGILKDNFKDEYKAFTDAYKALASRLKPMVYTLGFLKG